MCFGAIQNSLEYPHKIPAPDFPDLLFGVTTLNEFERDISHSGYIEAT